MLVFCYPFLEFLVTGWPVAEAVPCIILKKLFLVLSPLLLLQFLVLPLATNGVLPIADAGPFFVESGAFKAILIFALGITVSGFSCRCLILSPL